MGAAKLLCERKKMGATKLPCGRKKMGATKLPCGGKKMGATKLLCGGKKKGATKLPCGGKKMGATKLPCGTTISKVLGGFSAMDNMPDFMKMFSDKLGGDPSKLDAIFNMMQSSGNTAASSAPPDASSSSSNTSSFEMPDIEMMMKIKKVMDSMNANSNDPSVTLLSSLKPYLRDNKKSKVDQYIKLLNISKAMSIFHDLGGDSK